MNRLNKLEEYIDMSRINELLGKKEEEKKCSKCCDTILWILAVIGAVAAVAGIAYAVYRYLKPDYLDYRILNKRVQNRQPQKIIIRVIRDIFL